MAKRLVKRDEYGLYIQNDGWIGRAPEITKVKENDIVNATHPPGPDIFVRVEPHSKHPEIWKIVRHVASYPRFKVGEKIRVKTEPDHTGKVIAQTDHRVIWHCNTCNKDGDDNAWDLEKIPPNPPKPKGSITT
jgi:hypothetical protein